MSQTALLVSEQRFKQWTQPTKTIQVASTLTDRTRSKSELIAENMFLRQQLIVLERQVARPQLKPRDRQILVLLASRIRGWKQALVIVKPDTVVRWHQQGFKLFWRRKSRGRPGRPRIAAETIALIEEMAISNRIWRAKRIQGELLKLGINLGSRSPVACAYYRRISVRVKQLYTFILTYFNYRRNDYQIKFITCNNLFYL